MAQHASAEKRHRQTERRTVINRAREKQIRTAVKSVVSAIEAGDKAKAQEMLKAAQPVIMRGVSKGVLKLATASRKVSRLSAQIKSLKAS